MGMVRHVLLAALTTMMTLAETDALPAHERRQRADCPARCRPGGP